MGKINCPAVPELDGLDRFEARKKAARIIRADGVAIETESYQNNVGFSERSDVPIEPRISEQWFLRYPKAKEALAVVRDHLVRFFPTHWERFTRNGSKIFGTGALAGKCGGDTGYRRGTGNPKPQVPNHQTADDNLCRHRSAG